jgi:hypothetical protein
MLVLASPRSVVAYDTKGPYSHFAFPISGVERLMANARTSRERSNTQQKTNVVEGLPATAILQKATLDGEVHAGRRTPSETVVALPPDISNTCTTTRPKVTDIQHPMERVRQFLDQIPDLSFLLSSNLSLPSDRGSS